MARDLAEVGVETAKSAGLTYANDHDPGIRRVVERGRIDYVGPDGRPLRDAATLARIRKLVIPPAWTEVWISADPRGHIQAVGRDARGRKQYRYHADWRAVRDAQKFERLAAFGRALPDLRAQIETDLARPGLPREKVLAAAIRVMEITLIRVGNDEYARHNQSFGLTTLRKRHLTLSGAGAVFEFRGKSGKARKTGFRDRRLAQVLRRCQELPGQRLFQYVDAEGARHNIESADVNAYLRRAMGEDFSAKDFRTWAGTLAAARALRLADSPEARGRQKQIISACVKATAAALGNTPAVCRACYIHPGVITAFEADALAPALAEGSDAAEAALLALLEGAAKAKAEA